MREIKSEQFVINSSRDAHNDRDSIGPPGLERRHLTVVFSDLVGFTALSQELDPEELSGIVDWNHRICHQVMVRFGGYVARYVGDGILTYFGWPQATENDAERSVHAGLELVEAVSAGHLQAGRPMAIRVAIASGVVVVRTLEDGISRDVIGETPNVAARLQGLAAPNTVVIAPSTWRLTGEMFEYRDLGEHSLKGIASPVRVRQVLRARSVGSRFEGYREQWLVPFVGRTEPMSVLMKQCGCVQQDRGQAILISGEAGVGKSRLVREFCQRVRHKTLAVKRYQCSSLHSTTALYPVIRQIRIAAGFSDRENVDEQVEKLRKVLYGSGVNIEPALALVCSLLQIKSSNLAALPDLAPQLVREQLVEILCAQAFTHPERTPVLAIIEDVQWMDPTTEDLFLRALSQPPQDLVCLIATSREPFPDAWYRNGHAVSLLLDRLNSADSASLIRCISGGQFDERMVQRIVGRADGIPLFLEEVTRAINDVRATRRSSVEQRHREDIPATLQDLLTERLDRLGKAKHLAQIGSVFGRQFDAGAVRVLAAWSEGEVDKGIDDLLGSGLVRKLGTTASGRFVFKHSLVQDAAYESVLNSEKKRLHRHAFSYLESLPKGAIPDLAGTLSFHAERGEAWDKAAQYLIAACGLAIAKSANREAIAHFERGLAALDHLPRDQAVPYAIDLRLRASAALLAMGDIDRLVAISREADELAGSIGDKRRQAASLSQLANGLWMAGQHRTGLEYAQLAEKFGSEIEDFRISLSARFNHAQLDHALGAIREAAQQFASILEMLQGDLEHKRFGWTALPSVLTCGFLTWCAVDLGDFPLARRTIDRAFRIVDQVPDPYSIVYAHLASGLYHLRRGEGPEAVAAFEIATAVSERSQMVLPIVGAWLAAAYVEAGRPQHALALLHEADRAATYKRGGKYNWFYHHLGMAQAHLALGDIGSAQTAVGRAEGLAVAAEEVVHLAWASKLKGDIATAAMSEAGRFAGLAYTRALDIAGPRGLRPLEAHCYAGLAGLHDRLGRAGEAARHHLKAEEIYRALGLSSAPAAHPRSSK
jgi:class 3 adenylate cyclase/tetratricopeptide (TPR) repeat protein